MTADMQIKIFKKYINSWIITDKDRKEVLTFDKDLDKLHEKIRKENIKGGIVMFVPDPSQSLAPTCLS